MVIVPVGRRRIALIGAVTTATLALVMTLKPSRSQGRPAERAKPAATSNPTERLVFSEAFDDARFLERGWYDGARFKVTSQEPFAGNGCIEYHWHPKTSVPHTTSVMRRLFEPSDTVYLRFQLKLSPGWGWTGRAYHPHMIQFMTTENGRFHGPAGSHLTLYVEPWNGRLRLAAQDIQNKDSPHGLTQGSLKGGYNGTFYDSPQAVFNDAAWHRVEVRFKLNTLDRGRDQPNADGVAQAWVDGKLVVDRKDLVLRSTDFPNMKINQLLLAPYFGPGLLPHAQTLWLDELAVGK